MKKLKKQKVRVPSYIYITTLLCICIALIAVICLFVTVSRFRAYERRQDSETISAAEDFTTVDEKDSYSRHEVAQLMEDLKAEYIKEGRDEVLNTIRGTIEEKGSTLEALRSVYDDYIIISEKSGYSFHPVNRELNPNKYSAEFFIQNPDGTLDYKDHSGTVVHTGIDVSSHQGVIDWEQVAGTGIEFAIIRSGYRGYSEGTILPDNQYEANMKGALENKLHVGVYFFTQAISIPEMQEEVDFILENLKDYKIDGPIVLDVEEVDGSNGGRTAKLTMDERSELMLYFCDRIKAAGYQPMIYGNLRSTLLMFDNTKFMEYPLWYAYYSFPVYYPYEYEILQYSSTGKLPGIKTDVDLNLCFNRWW